ncbi:MAG: hypothetical protein AAF726_20670 [Planctomycetota bacterium]
MHSRLAIGVLAASTLTLSVAAQELAVNGGFEAGDTSSWTFTPTASSSFTVSTDANGGSFSGRIFNDDPGTRAHAAQFGLGIGIVNPDEVITVTFAAKGSSTGFGSAAAEFFSERASGPPSSTSRLGGAELPLTANWRTYRFTVATGPEVTGGITLQFSAITSEAAGSRSEVQIDDVSISRGIGATIGTNYCLATPNSTGQAGSLHATGSTVAADNDVTLVASNLPVFSIGFFVTSRTQGFVTMPGSSSGNLCLSGGIGRFVASNQILVGSGVGTRVLPIDLNQMPTPTGLVGVAAGETWNFQAWHRDTTAMGTSTSNFTEGLSITFQ